MVGQDPVLEVKFPFHLSEGDTAPILYQLEDDLSVHIFHDPVAREGGIQRGKEYGEWCTLCEPTSTRIPNTNHYQDVDEGNTHQFRQVARI